MVAQGLSCFQHRYSLSLMFSLSTLGFNPSIHLEWLVFGNIFRLIWMLIARSCDVGSLSFMSHWKVIEGGRFLID